MRTLFKLPLGQGSLATLLKYNIGACLIIFLLLEIWRPCYFLTDDNLSGGFPILTEIGRHLKNGQSPFVTEYLFGGHYNMLRDIGCLQWHPFYMGPALLADTPCRFWILDAAAFLFLVLTTVGFTILAYSLRKEFCLKLPDIYVIFYTLSFVFSTYVLTVGPSWITFLGNQSALPWLALGILDKKMFRGIFLVALFTIHEILCSFAAMTMSSGICLTLFAVGVTLWKRSPRPLFSWCAGNMIGLLMLTPLLLATLDGFAHTLRLRGLPMKELSEFSIPASTFIFSFFMGNWTEPITVWLGDSNLDSLSFPYISTLLACPAAWCIVPALFGSSRWRAMEILCLGLALFLMVLIIRPHIVEAVMHHLPFLKSMRWPFREGLQFLFFIHLFLILRPTEQDVFWRLAIPLFSLAVFILPLPFIQVPTLNPLFLDRQLLFSGEAEKFWTGVKKNLKPTDEIATVINRDYWDKNHKEIPFTLLGTANFPAFFKVTCASGYSPTAPVDQIPLETRPGFWFGAFQEDQVRAILAEKPNLKLLRIERTHPLKITMSAGNGPPVDLSPYLHK